MTAFENESERRAAAFQEFYGEGKKRLEKEASSYNEALSDEKQPVLKGYFADMADLNSDGKMLRGMLVQLGYALAKEAAGGSGAAYEKGMAAAASQEASESDALALAFEVMQTGILMHDDIIDEADERRGKATVHRRAAKRYGAEEADGHARQKLLRAADSAAICAGDYCMLDANRLIVERYSENANLPRVLSYFDKVILDTIRGELLDVVLPTERELESGKDLKLGECVEEIYFLKTAGYSVAGPLHLGMLLGGAPEETAAMLDAAAYEVGVAYQIKDDILGIFADAEYVGKDVGADIAEKKLTILYSYVAEAAPSYLAELDSVYGSKEVTPEVLGEVRRIFKESGALENAERRAEELSASALLKLEALPFAKGAAGEALKGFVEYAAGRKR